MRFFKSNKEEYLRLQKENEELKEHIDALIEENNAMRSRMDYVEELIVECEELEKEWEERVVEAKTARDNYTNLIQYLSKENT